MSWVKVRHDGKAVGNSPGPSVKTGVEVNKKWGGVTQSKPTVSGPLRTKAKHQTHSFSSAFSSHTACAMEKGWFRTELPSGAITYAFEALVSGADRSFHPKSGKSPQGLGGCLQSHIIFMASETDWFMDQAWSSWTGLPNNLAEA